MKVFLRGQWKIRIHRKTKESQETGGKKRGKEERRVNTEQREEKRISRGKDNNSRRAGQKRKSK